MLRCFRSQIFPWQQIALNLLSRTSSEDLPSSLLSPFLHSAFLPLSISFSPSPSPCSILPPPPIRFSPPFSHSATEFAGRVFGGRLGGGQENGAPCPWPSRCPSYERLASSFSPSASSSVGGGRSAALVAPARRIPARDPRRAIWLSIHDTDARRAMVRLVLYILRSRVGRIGGAEITG